MGELLEGEFGIELRLTSRKENGACIAAEIGMNDFSFCRGCQGSVPEMIKVRMPLNEFDFGGHN